MGESPSEWWGQACPRSFTQEGAFLAYSLSGQGGMFAPSEPGQDGRHVDLIWLSPYSIAPSPGTFSPPQVSKAIRGSHERDLHVDWEEVLHVPHDHAFGLASPCRGGSCRCRDAYRAERHPARYPD